jgi:hypothetical protein
MISHLSQVVNIKYGGTFSKVPPERFNAWNIFQLED